MDLNTTGSSVMLIFVVLCAFGAGIAVSYKNYAMATTLGLLSIVFCLLFCTAQILKRMG